MDRPARRQPGSRPAHRAGTVHTPVVLVLCWLRHRLDLRTCAGEAGFSMVTAYRYLHRALDVLARHAPDPADVLTRAHGGGRPFVCLDGILIPTHRVVVRAERGHHLWYSGKPQCSTAPCRSRATPPVSPCGFRRPPRLDR